MGDEKITVELTPAAREALELIGSRMNKRDVDEIVSAALVIYDMHQRSMVRQMYAEGIGQEGQEGHDAHN